MRSFRVWRMNNFLSFRKKLESFRLIGYQIHSNSNVTLNKIRFSPQAFSLRVVWTQIKLSGPELSRGSDTDLALGQASPKRFLL
jgi:hypothetical protein